MTNCNSAFVKTICSICYEDLKPTAEDLQAISICGHVFHELCLQQWFEYSSNSKCSCPVCKQCCKANDAGRLYFQSVDPTTTQRPIIECEEDTEALRQEVSRLESKTIVLNSALERQGQNLKELTEELCLCKEQAKKEVALKSEAVASKNEALKQQASMERMLHMKSGELDKVTLECLRLQEKNMKLAKELAAFKLISDFDLKEEDVLNYAALGNGINNKDSIDSLKKSLLSRERVYQVHAKKMTARYNELMKKHRDLAHEKARSSEELEKAKEKINTLKTRVQESERAVEVKDNEILRALKASSEIRGERVIQNGERVIQTRVQESERAVEVKDNEVLGALKASSETRGERVIQNGVSLKSDSVSVNNSSEDQRKQYAPMHKFDRIGSLSSDPLCQTVNFNFSSPMDANSAKEGTSTSAHDEKRDACSLVDDDASKFSTMIHGQTNANSKEPLCERSTNPKSSLLRSGTASDTITETAVCRLRNLDDPSGPITGTITHTAKTPAADTTDVVILDDVEEVHPVLNIIKESPIPQALPRPGDGTNRLGKWCKQSLNNGSVTRQDSSTDTSPLIAVGTDGRGGRIKVLRSHNHSSVDNKANSRGPKRCKYGAKTNSLQSQGCLQMEHFFGRSGK